MSELLIAEVVSCDQSLTACGFAHLRVVGYGTLKPAIKFEQIMRVKVMEVAVIRSTSEDGISERLTKIMEAAEHFRDRAIGTSKTLCLDVNGALVFALEGSTFGSPFQRLDAGRVEAAVRLGFADREYPELTYEPVVVNPIQMKKLVCPDWHGFSLANWKKAGITKEFKKSNPDKAGVMSGVAKWFAYNTPDDAVADAIAIGVCAVSAKGVKLPGEGFIDEEKIKEEIRQFRTRNEAWTAGRNARK